MNSYINKNAQRLTNFFLLLYRTSSIKIVLNVKKIVNF